MSGEKTDGKERFSLKNFGKSQWLILALLGLLLAVIAMPAEGKKSAAETTDTDMYPSEETDAGSSARELRLACLLEQMEGVGKVQVMIAPESGRDGQLFSDEDTAVGGALIVAEGADDPVTAEKIRRAVQALFQIESHKIEVMKMK